jgi:hypothetical protein
VLLPTGDGTKNSRRSDVNGFTMAAVFTGIVIADFNAALLSRGAFDYTFVLYAVAGSLLAAGIAYVISRCTKSTSPAMFSIWFVVVCTAFLLLGMLRL